MRVYLVGNNKGLLGGDEGRLLQVALDLGDLLGIQLLINVPNNHTKERVSICHPMILTTRTFVHCQTNT